MFGRCSPSFLFSFRISGRGTNLYYRQMLFKRGSCNPRNCLQNDFRHMFTILRSVGSLSALQVQLMVQVMATNPTTLAIQAIALIALMVVVVGVEGATTSSTKEAMTKTMMPEQMEVMQEVVMVG